MLRAQRWDVIPGAEPADEFGARVRAGMEAVADAGADGVASVAVTHAGVIAEALRQITGSEPFAFLMSANGSISRVDADARRPVAAGRVQRHRASDRGRRDGA